MRLLRTPEDRFADLPDFPWEPRYAAVPDPDGGELRMAYVEAGPADGPVVLLLHGEPSWSFLYRRLLPVLAAAGLRAVAPDLVGFGRSDKPSAVGDHTYRRHLDWCRALVFDVLGLQQVTLVGQDWGGLLGLRLVAEHPERFARVVAANTGLPTGDHDMPEVWWRFRRTVERAEHLDVSRLVQSGCRRVLDPAERAAYDAPFPSEEHSAGLRQMTALLPLTRNDVGAEIGRRTMAFLGEWERPFLTCYSDGDPATRGWEQVFRDHVPGAAGLPHRVLQGAGHFLQEDAGPELARNVLDLLG